MVVFLEYPPEDPAPGPASDAEIAACEKRLGLKLPGVLVSTLKIQNGGDVEEHPEHSLFESLYGVSHETDPFALISRGGIASLHEWLLGRGELESPDDTFPALEHLGDMTKLISISGIGTYHFLLDYREPTDSPKLYFLDMVGGFQELEPVADNLEEFFAEMG